MLSGISIKGQFDDGSPLTFCDDGPVSIKLGDAEAETYWSKRVGDDDQTGAPKYKLLPMDRA